ncbi:hypothetical protein EMCRGX_G032419 [Ephydatia muelleri]
MEILVNERAEQLIAIQKEYELVCEQQRKSLLRNELLLRDVQRLRLSISTPVPTAKLEALKTRYLTHVTSLHPERLQGCRQESSGTTTQPHLHLDAQARMPKRCVSPPPFVGTASERETVRKVISEDTVSKSSVTNISAESTGAGIAPPLMKAESTGAGIAPPVMKAKSTGAGKAPPVMKAESTGAGIAPPVMKAESTGAGKAPPVMKAESTGAGKAPPVMKAESTGAGKAPPVMKAESTGAGKAPPVMKAESTGAGIAPPVMKAESTGAGIAPPVMKAESTGAGIAPPVMKKEEGDSSVSIRPLLDTAEGGDVDVRPPLLKAHLPVIIPELGSDHLLCSEAAVGDDSLPTPASPRDLEVDNNDNTNIEDSKKVEDSNGGENLEDSGNLEESNGKENLLEDSGNLEDSNGGENLLEDSGNLEDSNGEQHGGVKCQLVDIASEGDQPSEDIASEGDQPSEDIASEGDQPSEDYQKQSSDFQIHTEEDPALHIVPALNQVQGSPSVDHHDSSSPTVDTVLSQLRTANNQLSQGSLFYTDKDLQAIDSRLLSQLKTFASTVCGMLPEQKQSISRLAPPPIPAQWSPLWPTLVQHFQLLHSRGRTLEDVATLFAPALAPDHPDRAEARLQLLDTLRHHIGLEDSSCSEEHAGQDAPHTDVSKDTGAALNESAAYRSLVMSMGTNNSNDSSSSSVDLMDTTGGLPITEIDDDAEAIVTAADTLQGVPHMTQDVHHMTQGILVAPPLHQSVHAGPNLKMSLSSHTSSSEEDLSSRPASPVYIPTAIESRPPQQKANAIKKLAGFWSDSDNEEVVIPSLKKDDESDF